MLLVMRVAVACVVGCLLVSGALGQQKCDTWVNSNGYTFPLSKLVDESPIVLNYSPPPPPPPSPNGPPPPAPDPDYSFEMAVCNTVSCPSSHSLTPNPQPAGCQSWDEDNTKHYRIMGQLQFTSITEGPEEDASVVLTYANGDQCNNGGNPINRTLELTLICDPEWTGELPEVEYDGETEHCTYRFTARWNKLGYCPTTYHPSAGPSHRHHKGPSGGTILLIIVAVFAVVYLVAGCVYKRVVVGAVGLEMIPNIEFWRALPGLVLDGVAFIFSCGKSSRSAATSYDTI